jgi:hypothetical protein
MNCGFRIADCRTAEAIGIFLVLGGLPAHSAIEASILGAPQLRAHIPQSAIHSNRIPCASGNSEE